MLWFGKELFIFFFNFLICRLTKKFDLRIYSFVLFQNIPAYRWLISVDDFFIFMTLSKIIFCSSVKIKFLFYSLIKNEPYLFLNRPVVSVISLFRFQSFLGTWFNKFGHKMKTNFFYIHLYLIWAVSRTNHTVFQIKFAISISITFFYPYLFTFSKYIEELNIKAGVHRSGQIKI